MNKMEQKKGFKHVYSQEKYDAYKILPAWQKLEWLEKMSRFLYNFMPQKSKNLNEKLQKGEI